MIHLFPSPRLRRAALLWSVLPVSAAIMAAADFHVSPGGDDAADGQAGRPLRTLARAIELAGPGDRCILHEGVYRETVTLRRAGVTVMAQPGDYVLLTGADLVEGPWKSVHNPANDASFFEAAVPARALAVFVNGQVQDPARWPDKTAHLLSLADWAETRIDDPASGVAVPGLPTRPDNFWRGGVYMGLHTDKPFLATWFTIGGVIEESRGDRLALRDTTFGYGGRNGRGAGFGYIIGARNALDRAGEWHWSDGRLALALDTPPGDRLVEAQTRRFILVVAEPDVTLSGLNFRAGTVSVSGDRVKIESCTFRDISPFIHIADPSGASNWGAPGQGAGGVFINANDAVVRDCYFGGSWWSALTLAGSRVLVENCLVEDTNWIGRRGGAIQAHGDDITIRRCTIRRSGATSIEGGNARWLGRYAKRALWELNRCEDAGCLVVDQGFFYVNHQGGDAPAADSIWRNNLLLRYRGPDRGVWGRTRIGLYVDNSSSGYRVHHNVVVDAMEGIRYNDNYDGPLAGRDVVFSHNTFLRVGQVFALGVWSQVSHDGSTAATPPRMDAGLTVRNNLGLASGHFGTDGGHAPYGDNNYGFVPLDAVVDAAGLDFRLVPGSRYADAGALLPGINDDHVGPFPDIGAYETGATAWVAGADLERPDFPDDDPPTGLPADRARAPAPPLPRLE